MQLYNYKTIRLDHVYKPARVGGFIISIKSLKDSYSLGVDPKRVDRCVGGIDMQSPAPVNLSRMLPSIWIETVIQVPTEQVKTRYAWLGCRIVGI